MQNNFEFFNKEVIKPLLISKFLFYNIKALPKLNKCLFSIYLVDINKYNILFSYIFFNFFLLYKKPCILNKSKRFPKKKIFYRRNNDLNFLINLTLKNSKKISIFLEFFLIIFLFSRFRKYYKKKINNFFFNFLVFQNLDFIFFQKYLKIFSKFSTEIFFIIKKMRLSLFIFYSMSNIVKIKQLYFKFLKMNK